MRIPVLGVEIARRIGREHGRCGKGASAAQRRVISRCVAGFRQRGEGGRSGGRRARPAGPIARGRGQAAAPADGYDLAKIACRIGFERPIVICGCRREGAVVP